MRVFIAILLDEQTNDSLEACRDRLAHNATTMAPIPRENFHVTLSFLGNVDEEALFAIEDALDDITNPLENTLVFDHAGSFTSSGRSGSSGKRKEHTWWMGLRENEALAKLQRAIRGKMEALGFEFEARAFTPHVTLARHVTFAEGSEQTSASALAAHVAGEPFSAQVNTFSLMESKTVDGKVVYEEICTWE